MTATIRPDDHLTIPDPDDLYGMPIYDGPYYGVFDALVPGAYKGYVEGYGEVTVSVREPDVKDGHPAVRSS